MIAAVIILAVLVLALAGFVIWTLVQPKKKDTADSDATMLLKADMTELTKAMGNLQQGLQKQLSD